MNTGRRIANPANKKLSGTFRSDRHADIAPLAVVPSVGPAMPASLSTAARAVWHEELRRVIGCGVTETDSSMFARYCEMEVLARAGFAAGELPKIALLTELRRVAELLGIAGLKSRLTKIGGQQPEKANPFSVLKQ